MRTKEGKGISEMPPQAVTLEPLVQGECVVTVLRLLGRTEHAHQPWSATFLWYEISAQGTGPLANISEKFCSGITLTQLTAKCYSNFDPGLSLMRPCSSNACSMVC